MTRRGLKLIRAVKAACSQRKCAEFDIDALKRRAWSLATATVGRANGLARRVFGDNRHFDNVDAALAAGQLPLPGVTMNVPYNNRRITVKPGEPVYMAVPGAESPVYPSPFRDKSFRFPWQRSPAVNTHVIPWYDRDAQVKFLRRYAKTNPVYVTGYSYGVPAALDSIAKSGVRVAGMTGYDGVSRAQSVSVPDNVRAGHAVHFNPHYTNGGLVCAFENGVARIGGIRHTIDGARNVDYVRSTGPTGHMAGMPVALDSLDAMAISDKFDAAR